MTNSSNSLPDIEQKLVLAAPIDKVWNTVSTSDGMASWFMPNNINPVVGVDFELQSPFGPSPCKVLVVEEPHRLSFTWDTDGWVVTFVLKEAGEQTEFTLIHGGWGDGDRVMPKANEKASVVRERMAGGWTTIVQERLKMAVEG